MRDGFARQIASFHAASYARTLTRRRWTLRHDDTRGLAAGTRPDAREPRLKEGLASHYTKWCNVNVDHLTDVLIAISHPSRRAIIEQLAEGPARFLDVAASFDTALNAVTKHLKLLERAGLIERERRGREVFISFRGEPLRQVAQWMHVYERFWNERVDEFQRHFRDKKSRERKS